MSIEVDFILVLKSNIQISKRLISYALNALNGHIFIGIIKNIVLFMVLRELMRIDRRQSKHVPIIISFITPRGDIILL